MLQFLDVGINYIEKRGRIEPDRHHPMDASETYFLVLSYIFLHSFFYFLHSQNANHASHSGICHASTTAGSTLSD